MFAHTRFAHEAFLKLNRHASATTFSSGGYDFTCKLCCSKTKEKRNVSVELVTLYQWVIRWFLNDIKQHFKVMQGFFLYF